MGAGGMIGGMIGGIGTAWLGSEAAQAQAQQAIRQEQLSGAADTYNAKMAYQQGQFAAEKSQIGTAQMTAAQKSAYADSGVDPTTGTAANVQANTAALGALDTQTHLNNAARQAWGFRLARSQGKENLYNQLASAQRAQMGAILGGMSQFAGGAASGGSIGGGSGDNSGDGSGSYTGSSSIESAFEGG